MEGGGGCDVRLSRQDRVVKRRTDTRRGRSDLDDLGEEINQNLKNNGLATALRRLHVLLPPVSAPPLLTRLPSPARILAPLHSQTHAHVAGRLPAQQRADAKVGRRWACKMQSNSSTPPRRKVRQRERSGPRQWHRWIRSV